MLLPAYVPGLSKRILDYGSVTVLGFNENTLFSNKSCKEITGSREVSFLSFRGKREKRNKDSHQTKIQMGPWSVDCEMGSAGRCSRC